MLLFESFKNIESICEKYNITNYTINADGSIDVDENVDLINEGLIKLPLKFNKVTGDFYCSNNQLTTLEGGPNEVGGDFYCHNNKLTTLEGGPTEVGGNFYCNNNKLFTLEGGPREVGGDFYCGSNKLTTLEGSPREVGGTFYCNGNPIYKVYGYFPDYKSFIDSLDYSYLRGTDIVKVRLEEALDELGIKMPNKINGYNWI